MERKYLSLKLAIITPTERRRITNGERVMWQTGPDECEVEIVDGADDVGSRLRELMRIFDHAERESRQRRKLRIPSSPKTAGAKSECKTGARSTARQMGDSRDCSEAFRRSRREK